MIAACIHVKPIRGLGMLAGKEKKCLRHEAFQPFREAWLTGGLGYPRRHPIPLREGECCLLLLYMHFHATYCFVQPT